MQQANECASPTELRTDRSQPGRLALLIDTFDLSLNDIVVASGRSISKSQLHRILNGQLPTPFEMNAVAQGILACIQHRCDSAFLFEGRQA